MERRRRRWWTWGLSIAASLVVLATTLSLAFRLLMDTVPDYRDRLQGMVAQALGHPTRIGSMALTWQRLQPTLDLRGVALLDPQGRPLLQAERLRIGFSLRRLVQRDWMPDSLDLQGLALEADVDALGHWTLRGFEGGGGDNGDALHKLGRLDRVRLRHCRLLTHDPQLSREPLPVELTEAELRHSGSRYHLDAQLLPPAEVAGGAAASADFSGDPADTHSWSGSWTLQLSQIHGWPWLAGSLGAGVRLDVEQAQLRLRGRIEAGRIAEVSAQGEAAAVAAKRGGEILARQTGLALEVTARPEPQAWNGEVRKLAASGARGPWSALGHFRYAVTAQGTALDADADGLRLDDLAPWIALWKELPAGAERVREVRGDLHRLALHFEQAAGAPRPPPRYSVQARLEGAGLAGGDSQPGFSGLDAEIEADQDGGHLRLSQAQFQLRLPQVFEQALPVGSLSGDFAWKPVAAAEGGGWRLGSERLEWKALGVSGHGSFGLLLPAQAEVPQNLQLTLDFAAEDVVALKPYMPRDWGRGTREWLGRALQRGRVSRGHLQLDGPLPDYPYVEKPSGHWILDLTVADAILDYAPDWPAAEKLQAQLAFRGHGLSISSSGAQIAGNSVDHIDAAIPDFRTPRLGVEGSTHSDAAKYYALLRASPIARKLSGLLGQTDASGPAAVDVHLDIPLDVEDPPVKVRGTARFDGATVRVRALDQPVSAVRGSVAFDDVGVTSEALGGQLYGRPIAASIRKEAESPDGVLLVQTDAPTESADGLFAAYVPDWLRRRFAGVVRVNGRLPFAGPRSGQLELATDLKGVALRLPPPLGKAPDETLPLRVVVGEGGGKGGEADALRLRIDGGDRLGVALRFGRGPRGADSLQTRSVEVRIGPGETPRADADGVFVSGAPAELPLEDWLDLVDSIDTPQAAGVQAIVPAPADSLAFRGVDLRPGRLLYRGVVLEQPHLLGRSAPDGWSAQLDGPHVQGHVDYSRAAGGRVLARLLRLELQPLSAPPDTQADSADSSAAAEAPPFDPTQASVLDLESDSLKLGGADFGRFSMLTSRVAGGQAMNQFELAGGKLQAKANGTWLRRNGSSYGDLAFELSGTDLGLVLQALDYAPTLDGRITRFSGALTWPQDPRGLQLAQARGNIALAVDKGVLNAVKPGAGRVLGLLNLYALPKRLLTLDFHDVTAKGLGFDHLSANFALGDGQARTSDLVIDAPALKMEMSGRIGLAARDYDEKIVVYPNVTTGVTVGATLIGGPIAGGIALLAQEAFGKPFNALSKFSYHLMGSWDNPQVKAVDKQDLPAPAEAPPADAAPGPAAPPATAPPADAPAADSEAKPAPSPAPDAGSMSQ